VVASLGKFTEEDFSAGWEDFEEIAWADVVAVLTVGKFCGQASELGIAEYWYACTASAEGRVAPQSEER
jgi:hypothetical protein